MEQNIDENLLLTSTKFIKLKAYWLNKLSGDIRETRLSVLDKGSACCPEQESVQINIPFSGDLSRSVEKFGKQSDISIYIILAATLNALIYRYTGNDDITVISPLFKSYISEETMNDYVFVRNSITSGHTFKELLLQMKESILDAYEHQDYPSDSLLETLFKTSPQKRRISNVVCRLQGLHPPWISPKKTDDVDFDFSRAGDGIKGNIVYNPGIYHNHYLEGFSAHFTALLENAVKDINTVIAQIPILNEQEKRQLIHDFNRTGSAYDSEKILHQLFEDQVERSPHHIALVNENKQVTYRQLNQQANRLSGVLNTMAVKPGSIVAIIIESSLEMILAMLGTLKAGGCYLPIDTELPAERLTVMLKDSVPQVVLTNKSILNNLSFSTLKGEGKDRFTPVVTEPRPRIPNLAGKKTGREIIIDEIADILSQHSAENPLETAAINSPAYIIYTSGSTGKPNGVIVEHRNVVAYIHAFLREFSLNSGSTVIQQASPSFDAFVEEVYPVLARGGKSVIPAREKIKDMDLFTACISKNNINLISCSPLLLSELNKLKGIDNITLFISGGDQLKSEHIDSLVKKRDVYNTYGPTEATVCVTYYKCSALSGETLPIGKPIANYQVYILDENSQLVPVVVPGEICISGTGLARGYLNQPELTAEKFVQNPFKGYLMYRSGDRGRWLSNGNIQFLGRIDSQVKIRGHRIELGEIETQLKKHPQIKDTVVVEKEDETGDKYLCAYYTADTQISVSELRVHLTEKLPGYMIPSYFMQMRKMPLTRSGKPDRKAFPPPVAQSGAVYAAPRNRIEEKLIQLWSVVLGIEMHRIGIDDNFFELGGHSLKATILAAEIHKEFDVRVPLRKIFDTPNIRKFADHIKLTSKDRFAPLKSIEKKEYYALSSAQKRIYILQQMDQESIVYNMPAIIPPIVEPDTKKLEETLRKLLQRHESLRTSFHVIKDQLVQEIHQSTEFEIQRLEGTGEPTEIIIKNFVKPFDLTQAPLLRVGVLKTHNNQYFLLVDIHHIISDGASNDLLLKDFMALNEEKELAPLRLQYKDFSAWQKGVKENIKKQESYWLKQFQDEMPVLNLPTDFPRTAIRNFEGDTLHFEISHDNTHGLKSIALEEKATLYLVVLAILNVFLAKISNQEDIVLGTPVAGRRHADLKKIIGMFVNTLPLRNQPINEKTFRQLLNEVRQKTLDAFENQEYQFEDLVDKLNITRDISRNPLFDVMYTLENPEEYTPGEAKEKTSNYQPGGKKPGADHQDWYRSIKPTSKFDLALSGLELDHKLFLTFTYITKLFKRESVQRFTTYFQRIASFIVKEPDMKLSQLEIIPGEEKIQLLYDFNNTARAYPPGKTLHELFAEQAKMTPERIALVGLNPKSEARNSKQIQNPNDQNSKQNPGVGVRFIEPLISITYGELNEKSNQLAQWLKQKGVKSDTIVGIMVERSVGLIVGLLGILKTGGAYLPIDPVYPQERAAYMLADCTAMLLVTTTDLYDKKDKKVGRWQGESFPVDNLFLPGSLPTHPLTHSPIQLCCVIYTSGSTGKPKGVMVEHRNVVPLVKNPNFIDLSEEDRLLLTGSIVFDITTFEIWGPLLNGLSLHLASQEEVLDGVKLKKLLFKNRITILHLVPQVFNQLASFPGGLELFSCLDYFMVGGDLVKPRYVNQLRKKFEHLKILHMYGPTENTTFSTFYSVDKEFETRIPIGKPISNSSAYVLDSNNKLQPIGIPGELVVGGDGVARGYLNNPELTAKKFDQDLWDYQDYHDEKNQKLLPPGRRRQSLYKTGDLARWLPDGNLEFLGRRDHQVKIRGVRIELGEIENILLKHKDIEACIVVSRKTHQDNQLIAYYKKKKKIELWPSLAEYFVYDDLIYHSMVNDETRNEKYRNSINKVIKDKIVLEIGPGSEAILARMCIEAGAKKVYAVEILEEAFQKAKKVVEKLGWQDKIILIHGDIAGVKLPEKVDYCVSEIVGSIGGSEGAAKVINSSRHLLKNPNCIIPFKSVTHIAAITLPQSEFEYSFDEIGAYYTQRVFDNVGYEFDLRLCLLSFTGDNIISNPDIFEELDFTKENSLEDEHDIHLEIAKDSILNGFIVWLKLYLDREEVIDTLKKKYIWLPIYFPIFSEGEPVKKGDYIKAKVIRKLSNSNLNPDFFIKGQLHKKDAKPINFIYSSPHINTEFKSNEFYKKLFSSDKLRLTSKITPADLRRYLAEKLPDYMVPSHFIEIEEMPLTSNGKIDRNALSAPELQTGEEKIAPRNNVEKKMVELWSAILNVPRDMIGIDSNFFELGGHSLKATILVASLHKTFNIKISLADIFRFPTIKNFSEFIKQAAEYKFVSIEPVEKKEYYVLSSAQKRLYILQQMQKDNTSYNMPDVFWLDENIGKHKLEDIINKLIARHESLRTSFQMIAEKPVQRVLEPGDVEFKIKEFEQKHSETDTIIHDFVRPFDLSQVPLLRVGLNHTGEGASMLLVDMHHIIADGVSQNILFGEFTAMNAGEELPPLRIQYKDYSQWQIRHLEFSPLKKQEEYWLNRFKGQIPLLKLPSNYPRTNGLSQEDRLYFQIYQELNNKIKKLVSETGSTVFIFLLAAFTIMLSKYTNQEDIVVGCPTAGRTHDDLNNIIGMFVNMMAMRNFPGSCKPFSEFLKEVKENAIKAFENQDYQFEELVSKLEIPRHPNRNPLTDIVFVMQNFEPAPGKTVKTGQTHQHESTTINEYKTGSLAKFDITLAAAESQDRILFDFSYRRDLFERETVEKMSRHLLNIIKEAVDNRHIKISDIKMLEKEEVHKLKKMAINEPIQTEASTQARPGKKEMKMEAGFDF